MLETVKSWVTGFFSSQVPPVYQDLTNDKPFQGAEVLSASVASNAGQHTDPFLGAQTQHVTYHAAPSSSGLELVTGSLKRKDREPFGSPVSHQTTAGTASQFQPYRPGLKSVHEDENPELSIFYLQPRWKRQVLSIDGKNEQLPWWRKKSPEILKLGSSAHPTAAALSEKVGGPASSTSSTLALTTSCKPPSSFFAEASESMDLAETFTSNSSERRQWKRMAQLAATMRPMKVHGSSGRRYSVKPWHLRSGTEEEELVEAVEQPPSLNAPSFALPSSVEQPPSLNAPSFALPSSVAPSNAGLLATAVQSLPSSAPQASSAAAPSLFSLSTAAPILSTNAAATTATTATMTAIISSSASTTPGLTSSKIPAMTNLDASNVSMSGSNAAAVTSVPVTLQHQQAGAASSSSRSHLPHGTPSFGAASTLGHSVSTAAEQSSLLPPGEQLARPQLLLAAPPDQAPASAAGPALLSLSSATAAPSAPSTSGRIFNLGFSFGASAAAPAATSAPASFSFGASAAAPAASSAPAGFSSGASTAAPANTSAPAGFSFGASNSAPAASSAPAGFSFGASAAAPAASSALAGFSFGASAAAPAGFSLSTSHGTNVFGASNSTAPTSTTSIFGLGSASGPAPTLSNPSPFGFNASSAAPAPFSPPAKIFNAAPTSNTSFAFIGQPHHSLQPSPFGSTATATAFHAAASPQFGGSPLPSMPFGHQQRAAVGSAAFGGFSASPAPAPFGGHQGSVSGFGGMAVPAGSPVFGGPTATSSMASGAAAAAGSAGFSLGTAQMSGDQSGRRKVAARRRAAGR
ncbi:hypothetical protein CEUSTIGMA_g8662.t1 [Chlamydomonas eustigma]|uniref:Uncharacterized protein n=1 Tax=Chlamydomonas eustigma TaxID=1157962 RepID=A0A250XEM4_9CHLO|nr:hypothetical protein CEUSTIGMA_g8662.t1 [Chlamydomonas eustigma]|eukprot:GAX81230.1 hypothetical protein CEUSTIGMA_g8662.t1 [Chlamydomonas eustigma]